MGSVVDSNVDNYKLEKKNTTIHSSDGGRDSVLVEDDQSNTSSDQLIGAYVGKSIFAKKCSKIIIGKVVSFDPTKKLYSLFFENGDHEIMDQELVTKILMLNHKNVSYYRKRKLENIVNVAMADIKRPTTRSRKNGSLNNLEQTSLPDSLDTDFPIDGQPTLKKSRKNNTNKMEQASLLGSSATENTNDTQPTFEKFRKNEYSGSEPTDIILVEKPLPNPSASEDANDGEYVDSDDDNDGDSSSDSCNIDQNKDTSSLSHVPIATLPPSSGDINIPDTSIPYLFSVYNFLRSFSVSLFLSPFGLDDFVGCLNCMGQNTLLDAIHLSLMQALRRHLESLPSEESSMSSKCLRHTDWTLLDSLTWPTILVGYLYVMGYTKSLGEKLCSLVVCGGEYYGLPVGLKLEVLQILCDDVVDSEEIKTELESRDDMKELEDLDMSSSRENIENGPRRVHPRNSKTSACKNVQALESFGEPKMTDILNSDAPLQVANVLDDAEDGNSDECRLCGMDGMLICCDGCPSAYHSRCIGLNKQFLPNGPWYCPECSVNKLGTSSSRIGRGVSGAEIFGTDANQRMFVGTCNYLLVVGAQFNSEAGVTYYNPDDITKVLSALLAPESASAYVDICMGISKYWEVPLPSTDTLLCGNYGSTLCPLVSKENCLPLTPGSSSLFEDASKLEVGDACVLEVMNKPTLSDVLTEDHDLSNMTPCSINDKQCLNGVSTKLGYGSALSELKTESHSSYNGIVVVYKEGGSLNNLVKNGTLSNLSTTVIGKKHQTFFRPQAYINQYIQGDIAASAAANLAVLSSDESKVSESRNNLSNPSRKAVAANIALQMKAFSGATLNFVWPAFDKRLFEIPRERCGWCMACRAATTWKRGCFLNSAASNAIKRFARNVNNGLRPVKQAESQVNLSIVGAHIAHMEECLRGLLSGALTDVRYKKQWHKLAREASTCKVLKNLLLDLEKSIHMIAFCGDWTKPVNDWLIEPCSSTSGRSHIVTTIKKRGHGRKPRRKQSGPSELDDDISSDISKNMFWWRGGKLSKALFQKGTLPNLQAKKASRQGGIRRISGVQYPDGPELPCRSRQFAWRASVEMTKNVSQLALQVRYLDAHLRWKDFIRPEQSPDNKSSDVDTMPFRNAVICDKKITENKNKYALVFTAVNHIPLRVTKNILEKEKLEDGSEKMWFLDNHIPLYLIKEYEEKAGLRTVPTSEILKSQILVKLKKRKLKDWIEIFSCLECKGIEPSRSYCPTCQHDIILRDYARCNSCQGHFHKDCTILSVSIKEESIEILFKCKSCSSRPINKKTVTISSKEPGQQRFSVLSHQRSLVQQGKQHSFMHSQRRSFMHSQNKQHSTPETVSYGLVWKRKNCDDTGAGFRMTNILLKGKHNTHRSADITCSYCSKPYHPELMYIRCQKCERWYHADAVELQEAQIFDLIGFKCCSCRKKASPWCPFAEIDYTEAINAKRNEKPAETHKLDQSTRIDDFVIVEDDPLLHSCSKVEPVEEQLLFNNASTTSTRSQQKKLSVRRPNVGCTTTQNVNIKCKEEFYDSDKHEPVDRESNIASNSQLEWDSAKADGYFGSLPPDNVDFTVDHQSIDEMEFEPQTYFSFTELLATDDQKQQEVDNNNNQYDISSIIDNSSEWPSIDFDDVIPWDSSTGVYDQGSTHNANNNITNNSSSELGVVSTNDGEPLSCGKCKLNQPFPDLMCEVCKLRIHSHCSPWEDCEGTEWRCGSCRDWR